jgi:AcrR family transcriptional regulator
MSTTRARLVQMAFEMFGRNGFHGVGLDRIIKEAGVSKQTFYNHFESKDDLVLAVLTHRHEAESKVLGDLMLSLGGDTPRGRLYAILDALDAWMNEPDWRGCIFMTAAAEFPMHTDPAHQSAAAHSKASQEAIQYLATLARARDPELLARQFAILIAGTIACRHTTGDERCAETAKCVAHKLLDEQLPADS